MNAGKYNKRIKIYGKTEEQNANGFITEVKHDVLTTWAAIRTTHSGQILANNSDFNEKHVKFTIRYPKTEITKEMFISYKDHEYAIEYLDNVDEADTELEIQTVEVEH